MMQLPKPGSDRASSGSLDADKFSALAGQVCGLRGEPGGTVLLSEVCVRSKISVR